MEQVGEFVTNHWILFTALAVITAMLVSNIVGSIGGGRQLTPGEAVQLINRKGAVVVDLRDAGEFSEGHIVSALNVPATKLPERLKDLERHRERPLLLCGTTGNEAGRTGSVLQKHGFKQLYTLKGGVAAWRRENLPLTRD
ncbi:MAG: rhodanese-like domain-containing protein [Chromatiales bacterium]